MMHSHLNFYSNSSSNGFAKPITLGGAELTPGLIDITGDGLEDDENNVQKRERSSVEKHVEIVEYLKRIPKGIRVSAYGCESAIILCVFSRQHLLTFSKVLVCYSQISSNIVSELKINLNEDINVLGMMKSNPKIDVETALDGTVSFSYRSKFEIG